MYKLFENWRFYLKEEAMAPEWHQQQKRKEYLQSYESGAHKDAWIRYLKGEVFKKETPASIIEKYYIKSIVPQVKKAIETVSVEKDALGKGSRYSHRKRKIKAGSAEKLRGRDSWEEYTFPHEFGHALDYMIDPLRGKNIPELSNESSFIKIASSGQQTMSGRQRKLCNRLFPGLRRRHSAGHEHGHVSCEEVYADIMALRNEINKQYLEGSRKTNKFTAEDVNNIMAVSKFAPVDLQDAILDYLDPNMPGAAAADLLNMFAAADVVDRTSRVVVEDNKE